MHYFQPLWGKTHTSYFLKTLKHSEGEIKSKNQQTQLDLVHQRTDVFMYPQERQSSLATKYSW